VIVIGIDPGAHDFAWARYDSDRNQITGWGTTIIDDMKRRINILSWPCNYDDNAVAIEDVRLYQNMARSGRVKQVLLETAKTIGSLQHEYPKAILIPRKTVAAALGVGSRAGNAEINRALGNLIPSFKAVRDGLNRHHRAAAAVAYVSVGRFK
jgi:Holliday junction resolvasome RuvABC endonuclease subunit